MSVLSRMSRTQFVAAAVVTVVLVGGGVTAAAVSSGSGSDTPATSVSQGPAASAPADDRGAAGGLQDPAAASPQVARTDATVTRIQIPKIGVDSGMEQLTLDANGVLIPPTGWDSTGWYKDGTVPGDKGPAVIAGHIDSPTAPAVFYRLRELAAGDQILVTLSNGETKQFIVDSQQSAPKDAFPTEQVYGPTPTSELRLITCDGDFNGATGHYVDNLIVNAHFTA